MKLTNNNRFFISIITRQLAIRKILSENSIMGLHLTCIIAAEVF
jgi:hypothetical protein